MIKEYEVALLLSTEFPEIYKELTGLGRTVNVYKTVQCFADYTIRLIKANELTRVKNCFHTAEKMMQEGSGAVRIAVENVYVFSIGILVDTLPAFGKTIREAMTTEIRATYYRQLNTNGV